MAGGADRLSELPNDLLRRVLHFVPLKEAASTTALSRRWRAPLWLSSGAVNLETGVGNYHYYCSSFHEDEALFFSTRDAFVSSAAAALDAAVVPVSRITLRLDSDLNETVVESWRRGDMGEVVSRYTGLVDVVLSHPAARRVEELRLVAKHWHEYYIRGHRQPERLYTVTLDSLPLTTLRVLELANCKGLLYLRQAAAIVLPRLSSIRLSHCNQRLSTLQSVIDGAPALVAVRLVSVNIDATDQGAKGATTRRFQCPAATVLVLDSCTWTVEIPGYHYKKTVDVDGVEIDAPRLRSFRYKGRLRSFSFSQQPLELEQVDLDLDFPRHTNNGDNIDQDQNLLTFWRFTRSFTSTKEMRLRVNHLDDIAVLTEARRVELLRTFCRLRRLEVQGVNLTNGKTPAVTILNLLRCCPMLSALRINLTTQPSYYIVVPDTTIPQKEIQIAAFRATCPNACGAPSGEWACNSS